MWPWGHLAIGYLCYVASIELRGRGEQTVLTLSAVGIGTQFPDLVDKPLAWTFAVLPSGRSLGHSLITATIVITLVAVVARKRRQLEPALAFSVGYVSHVTADLGPEVAWGLMLGDWSQLEWTSYLLWPVLPVPPYPDDKSFLTHFAAFEFEPYVVFQTLLFGVAVGVWVWTGTPGLSRTGTWVRNKWHVLSNSR